MTQRTKTALDTLFADNTIGAITPAMLRDFLESTVPTHGSFYLTAPVVTPIVTAGVFVKASGTTALIHSSRMTSPESNRLTYTGLVNVDCIIVANLSVDSVGNNQSVKFAVAQNGVVIDASIMEQRIGTGADFQIVTIHGGAILAPNDYLEIWCANDTSTDDLTIQRAYIHVVGLMQAS